MSDVLPAAVSRLNSWNEGDLSGKRFVGIWAKVTLNSNGNGAATHLIPASAFGLRQIEQCSSFVKADNSVIIAASPMVDKSGVILQDPNSATGAPANFTGDFYCTVKGQSDGTLLN